MIRTPKTASEKFKRELLNVGRKGKRRSRTRAIIIALRIVPMPGVSFNGIQQMRTKKLVMKVANPTVHPVKLVIP